MRPYGLLTAETQLCEAAERLLRDLASEQGRFNRAMEEAKWMGEANRPSRLDYEAIIGTAAGARSAVRDAEDVLRMTLDLRERLVQFWADHAPQDIRSGV